MISKEIAAVLSLAVYDQNVEPENLPLLTDGWIRLKDPIQPKHGFAYGVFKNAADEIVISYRGTDAAMGWDGVADISMYFGIASSQAKQAAAVFAEVAREHPASSVTFTGHSLGGGLASVMAVLFDRPAIIFDPAPFEFLARSTLAVTSIVRSLEQPLPDGRRLVVPATIRSYNAGSVFYERERAVQSYYAAGEFLQATRSEANTVYGLGGEHACPVRERFRRAIYYARAGAADRRHTKQTLC